MALSRISSALILVAWAAACGGAPTPPAVSGSSPPADAPAAIHGTSTPIANDSTDAAEPAPVAALRELPSACATPSADPCVPVSAFVERLCAKPHPEAALALFSPAEPFTRVYMKGRLDELAGDEETIVLRVHAPAKGGIVVGSGGPTYDLLRWDGSCALGVEGNALGRTRPPHPKTARVQWHRLGTRTQDALIAASEVVKKAHTQRGRECRGAMSGDVTAACARADEALVAAVVDCVRSGAPLPPTEDAP